MDEDTFQGESTMGETITLTEQIRDELVTRRRQEHSWRQLARYFKVSPSSIGH